MLVNRSFLHNRDLTPVILPPVSNDEQQDTNLEPQMIKLRAQNTARLYLDSQKPFFELQPNNIRISTSTSLAGRTENLLNSINRLAILRFDMFWQPQNVNVYNNSFEWVLTNQVGPVSYPFTGTIPIGQYTLNSILTELTNQMTLSANSVGLIGGFTYTIDPNGFNATINNNIPLTNFIFDFRQSSIVYNGACLLALPFMTQSVTTSLSIGPCRMLYTRYVDIVSNDLCSYVKNPNKSINTVGNNIVFRQYLDNPNNMWTYTTEIINLNWLNWDYNSPLSTIRFQLFDEWGKPFYFVPRVDPGTETSTSSLNWTMELILE